MTVLTLPAEEGQAPQRPAGPLRQSTGRRGLAYVVEATLVTLAVVLLGLAFQLIVVGRLQHRAAQRRAFDHFRLQLALGVAPTGQTDTHGRLLALGTPVALLKIPAIHVNEVVLEGTTSGVLTSGPGHLRDTVLPGQAGTSVVFGRAAAFGGPFGGLHRLHVGDTISVTTGIGTSAFKVVELRRAGDPVPPPPPNGARLTLVTATGWPFVPTGVLHVDADNVGTAQPGGSLALTSVPHDELAMASDAGGLFGLVLVVQALLVLAVGVVWSWRSWGPARTWVLFGPPIALAAYYLGGGVARLLPNLL